MNIEIAPELRSTANCKEIVSNALEFQFEQLVRIGLQDTPPKGNHTIAVEPAKTLLDGTRLSHALEKIGVPENARALVATKFFQLLGTTNSLLNSIFASLKQPSSDPAERAMLVFLPAPFGIHHLSYFAIPQNFIYAVDDAHHESEPLTRFVDLGGKKAPRLVFLPGYFLLQNVRKDGTPVLNDAVSLWLSTLFHELMHHYTEVTLDRWVARNLWLVEQSNLKKVDPLFKQYSKNDDGVQLLDDGLSVLMGESLSTTIELEVTATNRETPPESPVVTSLERESAIVECFDRFKTGMYGEGIQRLVEKGLKFKGETVPIEQSNFLKIGLDLRAHMLKFLDDHPMTP